MPATLLVAFALLLSPQGLAFNDGPPPLPNNTTIAVEMKHDVSAERARPGDRFEAKVLIPVLAQGEIVLPKGALVLGRVIAVKAHTKSDPGSRLRVQFYAAVSTSREFSLHGQVDRVIVVSHEPAPGLRPCYPIVRLLPQQSGTVVVEKPSESSQALRYPRRDGIDANAAPCYSDGRNFPPTPARLNTSPLKDTALQRSSSGITEFTSEKRNVVLKRGTMLEVRNLAP